MAYQPKSYKKFVATAATATLVATAVVPAAFAAEVKPAAFTDVAKQYEAAVNFVVSNNIAKGLNETQFGVSAQIKRGDAAIMIANAAGLNNEEAPQSGFSDVPTRGVLAINSLKAAGVVNGKSATNFGFNDSITRGEAAIMLANAFDLEGNTADVKFTDVSARYLEAVAALVENEVTNGISASQFGTNNNIKRGDFARFLYALEDEIVAPTPGIASVEASNGKVTATFGLAPETAPTAADFTVTRSINGGAATAVTPTNVSYDAATKAVSFNVPEVAQTNATQTVTYSVKYKDTDAKTASFSLAALVAPAVTAIASETSDTVVLVFNQPVDPARAEIEANYSFNSNTEDIATPNATPATATVTTAEVGPYAGNQIVTLTFAAGTVVDDADSEITISNMRTATGQNIPTATVNVEQISAAFGTEPNVTVSLVNGAQESANISANAGNNVTVNLTAQAAAGIDVSSLRYRIQNPDGTTSQWVSVNAADGAYDESLETATATINTTGFAGGAYTIQTEVVDKAGQVDRTPATAILNIVSTDITAPALTGTQTATYNVTATSTAAARTVSVSGSVADDLSNVTNVQYRVQSYNADTNSFTTTTDWTNATAADGTFNEENESYRFTTPQLSNSSDYRIQVRTTDAAGNIGAAIRTVTPAGTTALTSGSNTIGFTTPAASAGDVTDPTVTGLTAVIDGVNDTDGESITNDRAVRLTGTAADVPATGSTTTGTIANVQYGVFLDSDKDGSFETEIQAYTSNGVTAVDGSFNGASEAFTIDYTLPTGNGEYRVLVRTTDNSGNVSSAVSHDIELDTVAPTVTITPNTETPVGNDFVFTYSEDVVATTATSATTPSETALDFDNYTIRQVGQLVGNPVTGITQSSVNARQFVVTFRDAPTASQTINVTSVEDLAGNVIATTTRPVSQ